MHDGIRMPFLQAVCMAERHTMVVIDLYAELTYTLSFRLIYSRQTAS